jgi:transglutaminase-like putative cysteine protease
VIPVTSCTRRALFAFPVCIAAALVVAATQSIEHTVALTLLVVGALFIGPRFEASAESQHIVAGVALVPAAAIALPFTHEAPGAARLAGAWCTVATWAVLAMASRVLMRRPAWGARALLGIGSVAVLFSGYAHLSAAYVALAWSFIVACLGAARACDAARPPLTTLPRRTWAIAAAIVIGTVALSGLSSWGLPRLHDWLLRRYSQEHEDTATSGFSPWLELGAMQSMTLSDEVVLRVHGAAPSYLRGMVYDHYERGRWRNHTLPATTVVRMPQGPPDHGAFTRVERVSGIVGWYFLPLEARDVVNLNGSVRRDALGTVRGVPGDLALNVWFRPGARTSLLPAPPSPADLAVPRSLRATLDPMVARITQGAPSPADRIRALHAHLRDTYSYSLHFKRTAGRDPLVDFLTTHREGHCEYFASALALLARAAAVPTRVVGGYRVAERNPLGRYHVVRERNAHAWVEAWVDGAWHTYDATPPRAIPYNERHEGTWLRSAFDYYGQRFRALRVRIAALGSDGLLGVAFVLLVGWLAWRVRRARLAANASGTRITDRPLACMETLSLALSDVGLAREESETLEHLATRIEASALPVADRREVAHALRAYAALRYGAVGDTADVVAKVTHAAELVRRSARRTA